MFGISIGTAASLAGAAGSLAGGISGAMGSGGGELSSTQKAYNDWLSAQNYKYGKKQDVWMGAAGKLARNPEYWAPYGGKRVADFTPDQLAAFNKARQTAGGDALLSGAQDQTGKTLNGDYLNYQTPSNQFMGNGPSTANNYLGQQPSAQNGFIGQQPSTKNQFIGNDPSAINSFIGKFADYSNPYEGLQPGTANKYEGASTNIVNNPMLGMNNPYLTSAIDNASSDTIRNFNKAIAPNTDAAFARAGAFGGSAWGEQTSENQRNLADTLSKQATNARMSDYTNQQGLMNQNAQFQTGVNQSDLSRNAGLAQNQLGMNQQNWQTNAGLNQNAANLNQNTWQANLGALQNQNSLASQNWQANLGAQQGQNTLDQNAWQTNVGATQNQNSLNSQNWQANLGAAQSQNALANSQWATNAGLAQNQIDNNLRNYMAERGYQQDAINNALNLHNQGFTDANNLLQIGNQIQTQDQNNLNADMQKFKEWQDSGRAPIDWMLGNFNRAIGNTQQPTMTPNTKTNPYMGALGGAIGGYQLGNGLGNAFGGGGGYSYDGTFSGLPMFK
jgi:hypothetical protein